MASPSVPSFLAVPLRQPCTYGQSVVDEDKWAKGRCSTASLESALYIVPIPVNLPQHTNLIQSQYVEVEIAVGMVVEVVPPHTSSKFIILRSRPHHWRSMAQKEVGSVSRFKAVLHDIWASKHDTDDDSHIHAHTH